MLGDALKEIMKDCDSEEEREKLIEEAYTRIKANGNKSRLDMQLLNIYEERK